MKCERSTLSRSWGVAARRRDHHGLKLSEILEIIAMAALAVYANIIADATAMQEDEMFSTIGPPAA